MKAFNLFSSLASVGVVILFLYYGRDFLIPISIAIVIWYLINAIAIGIKHLPISPKRKLNLPSWLAKIIAIIFLGLAITLVGNLVSENIAQVSKEANSYTDNLKKIFDSLQGQYNFADLPLVNISDLLSNLDLGSIIGSLALTLRSIAGKGVLILIYVLFLMLEQHRFHDKLVAMIPTQRQRSHVEDIIRAIASRIQTYLRVKTMVSVATGIVSWAILLLIGVDYAEFWALIIFLLNYIPTIGSMLAVIFPFLLSIVQFGTILHPVLTISLLGTVQFIFGNVIEPRLMGRSLNLSPLVIMLALTFWGALWGVTGMLLCVPITVMVMIIFSEFEKTKSIAIMLSADGIINPIAEGEDPPLPQKETSKAPSNAETKNA